MEGNVKEEIVLNRPAKTRIRAPGTQEETK
jgi:hypothetical protein